MNERALQRAVIALARLLGWAVVHFRAGRTLNGSWRTPCEGDAKGWPDLVLVHPGKGTRFRELKGDGGKLSADQAAWIARLQTAGQDAAVWTSQHWRDGTIEKELRG